MHYDTILNNHGLKSDPFKACVGPRPIAWISTVGTDGRDNLAPFSQFNNLSFDPPMVMISFQHGGTEENASRKDTLNNIEQTGYFVYNIVPYDLRDKMNIAAIPAKDTDEFEAAGLYEWFGGAGVCLVEWPETVDLDARPCVRLTLRRAAEDGARDVELVTDGVPLNEAAFAPWRAEEA